MKEPVACNKCLHLEEGSILGSVRTMLWAVMPSCKAEPLPHDPITGKALTVDPYVRNRNSDCKYFHPKDEP